MGQDYFLEPGMESAYFPSLLEMSVTGFLVLMGCIGFTLAAKYLEVFPKARAGAEEEERAAGRSPGWVGWLTKGALVALAAVMIEGAVTFDFSRFGGARAEAAQLMSAPTNRLVLRLPPDLIYPMGEASPGEVVFSHAAHVNEEEPDCAVCHRAAFPLVRRAGMAPRMTWSDRQMHEASLCGMCHDGGTSFSVDEDCESCHAE
jgi:c(7)-type cytochrome triheme protein